MKEPLLSLTPTELREIAGALRTGRLAPPYSTANVRRFVGQALAESVASALCEFAGYGSQPQAIARMTDLMATSLTERPSLEDMVELVTTGPDAIGADNRETSVVVSELFHNANKSVIVAGYAVHQGRKVFGELADRMLQRPELQVRLYLDIQRKFGDNSLSEELVRRFAERFCTVDWPPGRPRPEVYYDTRSLALEQHKCAALHAKCIIVDSLHVFISSANFTEAAQERNIEVGLLLDSPGVGASVTSFFEQLYERKFLND